MLNIKASSNVYSNNVLVIDTEGIYLYSDLTEAATLSV